MIKNKKLICGVLSLGLLGGALVGMDGKKRELIRPRSNTHLNDVYDSLKKCMGYNLSAYRQVVRKARNPFEEIHYNFIKYLCDLSLVDSHGNMNSRTREVINKCVLTENMQLVYPARRRLIR